MVITAPSHSMSANTAEAKAMVNMVAAAITKTLRKAIFQTSFMSCPPGNWSRPLR